VPLRGWGGFAWPLAAPPAFGAFARGAGGTGPEPNQPRINLPAPIPAAPLADREAAPTRSDRPQSPPRHTTSCHPNIQGANGRRRAAKAAALRRLASVRCRLGRTAARMRACARMPSLAADDQAGNATLDLGAIRPRRHTASRRRCATSPATRPEPAGARHRQAGCEARRETGGGGRCGGGYGRRSA
jgi:hypothetical protein